MSNYGGKFGGWRKGSSSKDRTFANKAIRVHICRGCGVWHEGKKPPACIGCGRMDFDTFDSKGEAMRWMKLIQLQQAGLIRELERQVSIDLLTVHHRTGKPVVWGRYVADFRYFDIEKNARIVAEYKPGDGRGDPRMTYEAELKIRCVESMGIPVEIFTT